MANRKQWIRTFSALWLGLVLGGLGCGPSETGGGVEMPVGGACGATVQMVPFEGAQHVPSDMPVTYGSNPPASGMHYPFWGRWGEHVDPLPRGNYVHNLEHGGVVLLYRCTAPCPDVVAGLRAVMAARPQDPACSPAIRSRIVLTPDPLLTVPVAASAWNYVYRADCVDAPSLHAFIDQHYDQASESLCNDGSVL